MAGEGAGFLPGVHRPGGREESEGPGFSDLVWAGSKEKIEKSREDLAEEPAIATGNGAELEGWRKGWMDGGKGDPHRPGGGQRVGISQRNSAGLVRGRS